MLKKINIKLLALLSISSLILLANLGSTKVFFCDDEYLYIKIAYEMYNRSELWVPYWLGKTAFYKPPFNYWLMMCFFLIGGTKFIIARLSVAVSSVATVYYLYRLAERLYGEKEAFLAGLLFATSFGFITYGKLGMMDMPFTFFITASIYYFYLAFLEKSPFYASLFLILGGISCLEKGPVSVAILGLFAFLFLIFFGGWKTFFNLKTLPGWIGGSIFLFLWPLGIYFGGSGKWNEWYSFFIIRENFGKFDDPLTYTILDLLPYYLQYIFPWTLLFLFIVPLIFTKKNFKNHSYTVSILWAVSVILIFLIPETKLKHYMIPAIPTAALLISGLWYQNRGHILLKIGSYSTIFILSLILIIQTGILFVAKDWLPFLLVIISVIINISAIYFLAKKALLPSVCSYAFLIIILILTASYFTFEPFPREALSCVEKNDTLGVYRKQIYLYSYYIDRKAIQLTEGEEIKEFLLKDNVKIIIPEGSLKEIEENENIVLPEIKIIYTWEQWKSKTSAGEIYSGLRSSDVSNLKEKVYLIERKEN